MLPDPIQSSPDVDLFPFGPEASPGPLPAGLEVSSVEPVPLRMNTYAEP